MHEQTDRLFADSLVGNVTHTVGKSFPLSCPSPSIFPTQRMAQKIKGEPKKMFSGYYKQAIRITTLVAYHRVRYPKCIHRRSPVDQITKHRNYHAIGADHVIQ